ncbi:hypothetical protein ACAG26_10515 [Mycobacterium sp. pUA109]|uniref:hypothetical protein n=1 Tax=Mycobacterium sp. pUA109 TaxID=3238982 RepID=UPI00351B7538
MRGLTRIHTVLITLGAAVCLMFGAAPAAHAGPGGGVPGPDLCDYPGIGQSGLVLGTYWYFCDFPVEENSTHWHCEYGGWSLGGGANAGIGVGPVNAGLSSLAGVGGSCTWRNPDNSIGQAPNPPGAWRNYLVPKPYVPSPEPLPPFPLGAQPPGEDYGPPVADPTGPMEAPEPQTPAVTNPGVPNPGQTVNPSR